MIAGFEEFEPDENRRMTDPAIEVIVHKVTRMATDMDKLASSVEKMSESVQRLALAEERIGQVVASIERLNKRLDDGSERFQAYEERIRKMEIENVAHARSDAWVERAIVGVVVAVGIFAANKIGLM